MNAISSRIQKRNVELEELFEFEPDDLEQFAVDLGLDTLAKNRFLKSIAKLKAQHNPSPPHSSSTQNIRAQHIVVSAAEHDAMIQLFQEHEASTTLSDAIHSAIPSLDDSESAVLEIIEKTMDGLIQRLQRQKSLRWSFPSTFPSVKMNEVLCHCHSL